MYMGRNVTFECPHCGADTLAQVDHGEHDDTRCDRCDGYFRYEETDDGFTVVA